MVWQPFLYIYYGYYYQYNLLWTLTRGLIYLDIDSQQFHEVEIDRVSDEEIANNPNETLEMDESIEIEEFDTDLPAEHNVCNSFPSPHCSNSHIDHHSFSILEIWNAYQAFSTLNRTKHIACQYFFMML